MTVIIIIISVIIIKSATGPIIWKSAEWKLLQMDRCA